MKSDLCPLSVHNDMFKYADIATRLVPEHTHTWLDIDYKNIIDWATINRLKLNLTKSRNMFCGTWYLLHSRVYNDWTLHIITDTMHIFHCACTKRPYFYFRSEIWRRHRLPCPRFLVWRENNYIVRLMVLGLLLMRALQRGLSKKKKVQWFKVRSKTD